MLEEVFQVLRATMVECSERFTMKYKRIEYEPRAGATLRRNPARPQWTEHVARIAVKTHIETVFAVNPVSIKQ